MFEKLEVKIGADLNVFDKAMRSMNQKLNEATEGFSEFASTVSKKFQGVEKTFGSTFESMAKSMSVSQDEAKGMAISLTKLGKDLSFFKDVSIDEAMQALNGVFTGETKALEKLGIEMNDAKLKAFALKEGIEKNVDEMTQAEKATLRYNYVLSQTKDAQGSFINKITESSESIKTMGENLTASLTLPIGLAGAASIKLASDMQESLNKVNVAFGSSAQDIINWSKTSTDQMGLASGSALDAAALFGDMATSMGISQREASKMAMSLTQLGADLASFKNISIEQAMQALNGVFTGETESLKMLGVVMTETQLKAFALTQGITKNVDKMTEAELVTLRYAFVLDRTKNAQGDFARTADGSANQMRVFTETLKEIGTQLGTIILPVFNKFIIALNESLKSFIAMPEPIKKLVVVLGAFLAAIGPVLIAIGLIVPAITAASTAISSFFTLLKASTLTFAVFTNPVFLTIAAIGALTAAGVLLYKNWDAVKQKFEEMRIVLVNSIQFIWQRMKYYVALINPVVFVLAESAIAIYKNWEELKIGIVSALRVMKNNFVKEFGYIIDSMTLFIESTKLFINVIGKAFGDVARKQIEMFGEAWSKTSTASELALSREKYALEQRIKAINENAGKTDYMTSRSLIMYGQLTEEEKQLKLTGMTTEQLAEAKTKAAEAAKLASEKAKEFAEANEKVRQSAKDAANVLGDAIVIALKNKVKAEEESLASLQKSVAENKKSYDQMSSDVKSAQREITQTILDEYNKQQAIINGTYDELLDNNNQSFDQQIKANRDRINEIKSNNQAEANELIDNKYESNVKSLSVDEELLKNRSKLVEAFAKLALEREAQALADNRIVRLEAFEALTEEENKSIRDRVLEQRGIQIKGLETSNGLLFNAQQEEKKRIEAERVAELERVKLDYEEKKFQLERHLNLKLELMKVFNDAVVRNEKLLLEEQTKNVKALDTEIELQQKALELTLPKNHKELMELLKTFNPDWLKAGKSFGEELLSGLNAKKQSIEEAVKSILSQVSKAQGATVPAPEAKKSETTTKTSNKLADVKLESKAPLNGSGAKVSDILTPWSLIKNSTPFANGGIVTQPTLAMIGEAGQSEAVIPLNRLSDFMTQNDTHIYLDGREITRSIAPMMVDTLRAKIGYS